MRRGSVRSRMLAALSLMLVMLGGAAGISGCGSGFHDVPASYGVTVSATSGGLIHTADCKLNVT